MLAKRQSESTNNTGLRTCTCQAAVFEVSQYYLPVASSSFVVHILCVIYDIQVVQAPLCVVVV